jgi:hypothetical protein
VKTLYTLSEPSAAGITLGGFLGNLNLNFSVLNRLSPRVNGSEVEPSYLFPPPQKLGDFMFTATYLYGHEAGGSGVTLSYYKGLTQTPTDIEAFGQGSSTSTYGNSFHRITASANSYLSSDLNVLAGVGWGQDQLPDETTGEISSSLRSLGYFGELEYFTSASHALGVRWDQLRPDNTSETSPSSSFAAFSNWLPINQVQLITEYRFLMEPQGASSDTARAHSLAVKAAFFY